MVRSPNSRKGLQSISPLLPVLFLSVGGVWLFISEIVIPRSILNRKNIVDYHFLNLLLFITTVGTLLILLSRRRPDRSSAALQSSDPALIDPVTQLPRQALFNDRLQQALIKSKRENRSVAVLLVAVGKLREIFNTLGQQYGEMALKAVGGKLQKLIRQSDTVSYLGDNQFGICLVNSNVEGATRVSEKILRLMEEALILEELAVEATVGIGIAVFPDHAENFEELIRCAEIGKEQAREDETGFAVYTLQRDQRTKQTLTLLGELRRSIEKNQLFMVYQPKIELKSGRIAGVEALVRWRHPVRGLIPPDQFIPLAEQSGLIRPLSAWVIDDVLRQSVAWLSQGLDLPVAINLSRRNLHDPDLFQQIISGLESRKIRRELFELEITESVIMSNLPAAIKMLTRLSEAGIQISMDDFGTGYSSLASLKKLPIRVTKIDKSFVMNMIKDKDDAMIVQSTIDLAHNLGLKVVAEGVENQATWDVLATMGCDQLQGYHITRPIPPDQLVKWINESPWEVKKPVSIGQ